MKVAAPLEGAIGKPVRGNGSFEAGEDADDPNPKVVRYHCCPSTVYQRMRGECRSRSPADHQDNPDRIALSPTASLNPYNEEQWSSHPLRTGVARRSKKRRMPFTTPPRPAYYEDAHARQYKRAGPQFNGRRFAERVIDTLRR